MFESVHGSAPDIAGLGIANPIGSIESAALMLRHLGYSSEADRIQRAIDLTTSSGLLPRDLGGEATTEQITSAIVQNLGS
jgi:tartrate dehydrogenase/decarboxylase/D-malate dehydrogenase